MAEHVDNLVLGRGRLYFERFATGTRTGNGAERYLGSTPELSVNQSETTLDHRSMEGGRSVKDRSVALTNDTAGSFTTDDISKENVALWYLGSHEAVVIAAGQDVTSTYEDAKLGTYFQLGKSAASPAGARNVTGVTATVAAANVAAAGNFEVDEALGRVYILPDAAGITDGDDVVFTFDVTAGTEDRIIPDGEQIHGALRFIADNAEGDNDDRYWPYVKLAPDGDHSLKGDDWQTMSFNFEVLKLNDSTPNVIITRRAAAAAG